MNKQLTKDMLSFIAASPTGFHAAEHTVNILKSYGYTELDPASPPSPGSCVYTRKNGSTVLAFKLPAQARPFMAAASHSDSPCFRIKGTDALNSAGCSLINTEKYGGMIMYSWLDRPLSIAGRVTVNENGRLSSRLINIDRDVAVIPSLAIHMNRGVNDGYAFGVQKDMCALLSEADGKSLSALVSEAAEAQEDSIISTELFLYNRMTGGFFGANDEFIYSPRLDDLENAYISLKAFLGAKARDAMPVLCIFDNEETGSSTKQGAASSVLEDALSLVYSAYGKTPQSFYGSSFMLSIDNAHAVHPAHTDKYDPRCRVRMNGGVVIKHNTNYATDSVSSAAAETVADAAGMPIQHYYHKSDLPCGSTLGNIAGLRTPVYTADIGLAQLAMHSSCETAGVHDPAYMYAFLKKYYSMSLEAKADGLGYSFSG